MKKIYTIGHSNKPVKELINLLLENKIEVLIDVRSIPYSKYNPQFNRESLQIDTKKALILYVYRGRNLGGLKGNTDWQKSIDEICEKCNNRRIAVMCSEGNPNDCHRQSDIQPAVEKQGVEVEHILWPLSPTKQKEFDKRIAREKERAFKPVTLFD